MRAHARLGDPDTSHQAADAVSEGLRELQARVADYAKRRGEAGFTDAELSRDLEDAGSTFRTRRAELAARHIVIDSGRRRAFGESPRLRIIWLHRDFVPGAPDVIEAPAAPASKADRDEATRLAASLVSIAAGFRRQGYGPAASTIEAGAKLLKRFAA